MVFSCGHVWMWVGLWRTLSAEELMLLNSGVGEDSWESLGLQGDPTSPLWRRSALGVLWKEWCLSWNSSTWSLHVKSWLIGKDSNAGRDWGQEEKGTTEDEMAGWHHGLDGHEFEWTLGVGDGQGGLACCDSWGHRESDMTELLNYHIWPLLCWGMEQAMAPHSSTLAWKIPWMEEPGGLQSVESLESDTTERFHFHFSLSCIGEGNGNPLQCSCLENPRDGGACWATVCGVAQSRTRLSDLTAACWGRFLLCPFFEVF